jgi:ATP-dependent HslUV protease ATP-binding subunit HslU
MKTEGLTINFTEDGVKQIAQSAFHVNESAENIGARRLHTIMERLLEDISFTAPDRSGETISIDAEHVNNSLAELIVNEDLSRYIL